MHNSLLPGILVVAIACIGNTLQAASEDVINNGSFEDGLNGWQSTILTGNGTDSVTVSERFAFDGTQSLAAAIRNEGDGAQVMQTFAVEADLDYELSFYCFTENRDAGQARALLFAVDSEGKDLCRLGMYSLPATANIWIDRHDNVTVPTGAAGLRLEFYFQGPGSYYIDNVAFRKITNDSLSFSDIYPDDTPIYFSLNAEPDPEKNFPFWTYLGVKDRVSKLATALGVEYSLEEEIREAAQHHLAPFYHFYHVNDPKTAREVELPVLFYPNHTIHELIERNKAVLVDEVAPGILHEMDPVKLEKMQEVVENENFDYASPDAPKYFFIHDEIYSSSLRLPKDLDHLQSDYWKQMEATIRDKYGFGKFGIPRAGTPEEPFQNIAFLRYMNELSYAHFRKLSAIFRKRFPDSRIVGCDEWSAYTPLDWEKMRDFVDIQPGQCIHTSGGIHRFSTARMVKFYADLTGLPVYPYLQIVKYPNAPDPEYFDEIINQALRTGAEGCFVGAVEWYDRGNEAPQFSAPENWERYLARLDQIRRLPKVELPKDRDIALHFSSYSQMARGYGAESNLNGIFVLLGPRARGWFTYTDDFRVERDASTWDPYQTIILGDMKYSTDKILDAVENAAERGATVVLLDPDAFTYKIDSTPLELWFETLTGVRRSGLPVAQKEIQIGGNILATGNPRVKNITILDSDSVEIIATYADGSPALTVHRFGKGEIWYSGVNLSNNFTVDDPEWAKQFREWILQWGGKIDYPIWRAALPPLDLPVHVERKYHCYTGNAALMVRNQFDMSMNVVNADGAYRYAIAPQMVPDYGKDSITFSEGKLTNRRNYAKVARDSSGYFISPEEMKKSNWSVIFGKEEVAANFVELKLAVVPEQLKLVRLYFSGNFPASRLEVSVDGKEWKTVAEAEPRETEANAVALVQYSTELTGTAFLRIAWDERQAGTELSLVEIDVWGE